MEVMLRLFAACAAWFVADLLTGLFHLLIDSLGGTWVEKLPALGTLVRDFRMHHEEPDNPEYLGSGWYKLAPATLALALAGVGIALLIWPWTWLGIPVGLGVALSQQAHRWAHGRAPLPVRRLQKCHLLLPPRAHAGHHANFRRYFGSLNGWSNPLLNAVLGRLGL